MRVRSTDGVELRVHDLGGDGPDLLLAHGTGLHGLIWAPLAGSLPGFHLWSFDVRAHGDSTAPVGRALEWDGFADDVLAVVDAIGADRPFGVGHSMGAAALLRAEQLRPGTFRSLYCYEPVVVPGPPTRPAPVSNPMADAALRRRATFADHDEARRNYGAKPPLAGLHPESLEAYVTHGLALGADGAVTLKCRPEDEAEVFRLGAESDAWAHLGEVRCPVTLGVGDQTWPPASFVPAIAAALPDARVVSSPSLSHFGPFEDPAAFAASVGRAFAADDPAALS